MNCSLIYYLPLQTTFPFRVDLDCAAKTTSLRQWWLARDVSALRSQAQGDPDVHDLIPDSHSGTNFPMEHAMDTGIKGLHVLITAGASDIS